MCVLVLYGFNVYDETGDKRHDENFVVENRSQFSSANHSDAQVPAAPRPGARSRARAAHAPRARRIGAHPSPDTAL